MDCEFFFLIKNISKYYLVFMYLLDTSCLYLQVIKIMKKYSLFFAFVLSYEIQSAGLDQIPENRPDLEPVIAIVPGPDNQPQALARPVPNFQDVNHELDPDQQQERLHLERLMVRLQQEFIERRRREKRVARFVRHRNHARF